MENYFLDFLNKHGVRNEIRGDEIWYQCPLPGHENGDVNFSASYSLYKNKCNCFVHGGGIYKLYMFLEHRTYEDAILEIESHHEEIKKIKFEFAKHKFLNKKNIGVVGISDLKKYREKIHKEYTFKHFTEDIPTIKKFEIGFDKDSGRITIPVKDKDGNCVFVIKRSIFSNEKKRFINEPKDCKKSEHVFGLHLWKNPKYLIVVESPKAVIRCVGMGFKNIVAIMGSKPSETQLKLLCSKTDKLYIALDNDVPGKIGLEMFKKKSFMFINGVYVFEHPQISQSTMMDGKIRDIAEYEKKEIFDGLKNAKYHCKTLRGKRFV